MSKNEISIFLPGTTLIACGKTTNDVVKNLIRIVASEFCDRADEIDDNEIFSDSIQELANLFDEANVGIYLSGQEVDVK